MNRRQLRDLYRVFIEYLPPDIYGSGDGAQGCIQLMDPYDERWVSAWDAASLAERQQYGIWLANLLGRVTAGLAHELAHGPGLGQSLFAEGVVDRDVLDFAVHIEIEVPDDDATAWVARVKALIGEVIAADQRPAPQPVPEEHGGHMLSDQSAEERTR